MEDLLLTLRKEAACTPYSLAVVEFCHDNLLMMADALYGLCMEDLLLTLRREAAGAPCGLAVAYLTRDNMILWRVLCLCLRVAKIVHIDVQIANWAQLYTGSFFVPCGCCLLVVFQFPGAPKVLPPLWRGGCSTQGQCQEATEVSYRGELPQCHI